MKRIEPGKGRFRKFLHTVFPALLILALGILAFLGFMVFRITHPRVSEEALNPSHYLLSWLDVNWTTGQREQRTGWWIAGVKGAPGIIVAPGYGMNRSGTLSLVAQLHKEGFHVLVCTARGSESPSRKASSLGLHEAGDMNSALAFLKLRPDVDLKRIGIWGVDESARAALATAASNPEVRAVVADAPYEYIPDFVGIRIREEFGFSNALIEFGCVQLFRLAHITSFAAVGGELPVRGLPACSVLFVQGLNNEDMARLSLALYGRVQPQKQMLALPRSRSSAMSTQELNDYDRQVTDFFRSNLAAVAGHD